MSLGPTGAEPTGGGTASAVEERLARSLADRAGAVAAPPDADVRRAVARRVVWRRPRRRRLTAGAVGTAVVVAAVAVVAGLSGADEGATPVHTGPDAGELPPTPEEIPALTVEGYAPVEGESSLSDPPPGVTREPVDPVNGEALSDRPTVQAFRRPGDLAGPGVVLTHGPAVEWQIEGGPDREVVLPDATAARLVEVGGGGLRLWWQPDASDALASAQAWGMTSDDFLAFAAGLVLRPGGAGFEATVLPAGIDEDPIEPPADPSQMWVGYRVLDLEPGPRAAGDALGPVHVTVMRSDEADFELTLAARASGAGAAERVTVLGRPAVLVPARGMEGWWTLLWRHDAADRVEVRIAVTDRAAVDRVIAALREVDAQAFTDLLGQAGERAPEDTPPSTTLVPRD